MLLLLLGVGALGCASRNPTRPRLAYDAEAFREAVQARAPELSDRMLRAPTEVPPEIVERARARVMAAPPGPPRVRALLDFLSAPEPRGLGLVYDWATSSTAKRTIELGKGDCVALATVMVGLGRGLHWPIYFAEARTLRPETHEFEALTVLSDHMVVIVAAKTVQMVIDFLGRVEKGYDIRPIDDLTAYAHLINNVAGRLVTDPASEDADAQWRRALAGFELATRIQPELGRAWNNLGIAYARFGRFEEAREAYRRAVALGTAFGSAERNLIIMETRARGEPTLIESELP
jgi:tetratricopeptide (TPR) repeat protein